LYGGDKLAILSYKDLEIYQKSFTMAVNLHNMTLELPKFELFEEGSQIRRSSKSIVVNIVEGFGRRRYKNEFIRFLTLAHASCDETKVHLNFIHDTGQITEEIFNEYIEKYDDLGKKTYNFIKTIEKKHKI
jgi:four helix bundle protein